MRSWWDEAESFHLRCAASADAGTLWDAAVRAAASAGLADLGVEPGSRLRRRNVGLPGASRAFGLNVVTDDAGGPQILVSPAFDGATDEAEADRISEFAYQLGIAAGAIAGRSFSYVDGNGFHTPDEVDGPLRWVDWLQYFDARVADRIGRDLLGRLPVHEVRTAANGAVSVRARLLPYAGYSRRELAQHLNIDLRPMRNWDPSTRTWSEREWPT